MEILDKIYSLILTHKITTIAILAVLVIILYFVLRKSKAKYYRLAAKCHKKGEKFYELGDTELAEEYYNAAEDYRKKAGEIDVV